jgi:formate dehydrogenase gamma subunit
MASRDLSGNDEYVRRFNLYRIIEHLVLIMLFVALATTGLVQKFYALSVSRSILAGLGGIDSVRHIHHIAGVFFAVLAAQHILVVFIGIIFCKWQPSMLITLKDAHDALHNVRYYMGLLDSPVKCGRYIYKEKFAYWLILLGGIQMTFTGLFLWFPVDMTKYISGEIIPVSKIIHTNDAMLIFLLIAVWHIYDNVLNPEVFPLNKSIFTGYIKKRCMEKEHPLELKELMSAGDEEELQSHSDHETGK